MDYLKSLTIKQWLVILGLLFFFAISYFIFFRKPPTTHINTELENLIQQGTAPVSVDESLNKSEIETLIKQGSVTPDKSNGGQPKNDLTKQEQEELLRLMSAPK